MAVYTVFRLVDAYVRYETEIEADTPQEAWDIAHNEGSGSLQWEKTYVSEYDHSLLGVQDINGNLLIEETEE